VSAQPPWTYQSGRRRAGAFQCRLCWPGLAFPTAFVSLRRRSHPEGEAARSVQRFRSERAAYQRGGMNLLKMTTTTNEASALRSFLLRAAVALAIVTLVVLTARAGGPKYIAGTTYFNSGTADQPITWAQGQITYFTDQGDVSSILPNSAANTFVANAFSVWTSVSTAALSTTSGGQLAEDANGSTVPRTSDGTLTIPADIQPDATDKPVAVVYDID